MKKYIWFSIGTLLAYILFTVVLFYPRLPTIFTHYAMPDVDTDGGLWYQWYVNEIKDQKFVYDITPFAGYPFGYDIAISPADNLVYSTQVFILRYIIGFTWQNLIFITNISSLITYPLSAFFAYCLALFLTKHKKGSFLAGLVFGFSFYHVFMGRGQMSINHIEFIPLYFLCVYYYLQKKGIVSLLLTGLMYGILFKTDAYYAFFSMLFTPVLFLTYRYKTVAFIKLIQEFFVFHISVVIICILININFFISNLYLFDATARIQSGRNSVPRNELATILYFFFPYSFNLLSTFFSPVGNLLYSLPVILGVSGIMVVKQRKVFLGLLLCFIVAMCLSMYIPSLYWLNLLYFKFFSMFRGVGRIILLASLFLGILIAYTFAYLDTTKKIVHRYSMILLVVFTAIYLLGSVSTDDTWRRKTNFEALAKLYQPLKENRDIHVIATYPNTLNFNNRGFPQPYQLLGQIIHEKNFANGADFRDTPSDVYQGKIKDIASSSAIPALREHGVDTVLIYNRLLDNAPAINKILSADPRLSFIGHYTQPGDNGYTSANDKSRDISLYAIKGVKRFEKPYFSIENSEVQISVQKMGANIYKVRVPQQSQTVRLLFTYPYTAKWGLYEHGYIPLPLNMLQKELHKNEPFNRYINSWVIPKQDTGKDLYIIFKPEMRKELGDIISFSTFILLLGIIVKLLKYKKNE